MKGINHIITGVSAAIIADTGLRTISYMSGSELYDIIGEEMHWQLFADTESQLLYIAVTAFVYILNIAMFVLGCLLPDCDQEKSIAGRMLYVPVRHRTWTHTIWCVILFGALGIGAPCFYWLACGYTLHIFFDSLSKGGICWFYPISQYKKWTSGAQVKKNHKIYLYRTGEMSEAILVIITVIIAIITTVWAIQLTVVYGGLPFHGEWLFVANPV